MNPQNVLDATPLIVSAGASVTIIVQLAKAAGVAATTAATIITALVVSLLLTFAYALSAGALTISNLFVLITAWVTIAAVGAGIHGTVAKIEP